MRPKNVAITACFILLTFYAPLYAMTFAQMEELPGAKLIASGVDTIFTQYGLPAMIVDHGAQASKPGKDVKWRDTPLTLTTDDWTLVYSPEQEVRKDPGYWVNPAPSMPPDLSGIRTLVLLTYGNARSVVERNRRTRRFLMRAPADIFQAHQVYQVTAILPQPQNVRDIVEKYGRKYQEAVNGGGRRVLRYWAIHYMNRYPANAYSIDFELKGETTIVAYTISGVRVDHVQDKLNRMQREYPGGCPGDEEDPSFRCGEI